MEAYIGQVTLVGFSFAPRGWAVCAGQLLPIATQSTLFSLLGTTYGGDGRTTFGLPDLQGRAPVGVGHGPGLSDIRWGQKWGREYVTLSNQYMPAHTHSASATFTPTESTPVTVSGALNVCTKSATHDTPAEGDYLAVTMNGLSGLPSYIEAASVGGDSVAAGGLTITASGGETSGVVHVENHTSGGSLPFNIHNPSLGMYYVIAEVGIYPSRN